MSKRELKLGSSKDWDAWIAVIRGKATGYQVWDLIDPSKPTKPESLPAPIKPTYNIPANENDPIDPNVEAICRLKDLRYKAEEKAYCKQQDSFAKLNDFIYDTITVNNTIYIQKTEPHPYYILRQLKQKLAPSDSARSLELERQYEKLRTGPSNRQNIEAWLDDWMHTYTLAKEYKIAEVVDTRRALRDFLLAIESHAPTLTAMYELMDVNTNDEETRLMEVVEKFRHHIRLREIKKSRPEASHSAFAADEHTDDNKNNDNNKGKGKYKGNKPSFRGKDAKPGPCFCELIHWYSECYYLRPELRPQGWKQDPIKKKKVDDAMRDPNTRAKVNRAIERSKEIEAKRKENYKEESPKPIDTGTFPVLGAAFAVENYILHSSWIHDGGSAIHIANSTMKDRITIERKCADGSTVLSGNGLSPIHGYGTIKINVDTPNGIGTMTLTNVFYVPDFVTNVVGGTILDDKGVFFDAEWRRLRRGQQTVCWVTRVGGHYVLEDNTAGMESTNPPATFTATRLGTTTQWHQLLAHANNDAVQHLPTAAEGVELTNKDKVPATNECEPCALSKAHRIISRSPTKAETSDKPFFRITFDLMQFTIALNKEQWISHIACSEKDFNMVYTHRRKSEAPDILREAIQLIKTRFGQQVAFLRSDGETSLDKKFLDHIAKLGITWEPSAPATPEQNGHSERKGGILAMKARAMRIDAQLPVHLWPWIIHTAGFLMNRTPMRKHRWKTPFEMITGRRPDLSHLRRYGCKAYPINKAIPRTEKLAPRAHIGFLVGYVGTNLYNIWIPSQHRVIKTRDATFNENAFYDPSEIDLYQLVKEPFLHDTLDIPQTDTLHLITEIDSDSDEDVIVTQKKSKEDPPQEPTNEKGKQSEQAYLPSPSPSASGGDGNHSWHHESSDQGDTFEDALSFAPLLDPTSPPPPPPMTTRKTPRGEMKQDPTDKHSGFHEDNILPDTVKRSRGKKEKEPSSLSASSSRKETRKAAYAADLDRAANRAIDMFHATFAAFIPARTFYEKEDSPTPPVKLSSNASGKLHRDHLPPEPKNFWEMLKHPHAKDFKRALSVEISSLQEKGT